MKRTHVKADFEELQTLGKVLEKVMKDISLWLGPHSPAAGEKYKEEEAAETKTFELKQTSVLLCHPEGEIKRVEGKAEPGKKRVVGVFLDLFLSFIILLFY